MKVAILDDWFDTLRTLPCFERLADHEVTVFTDHVQDIDPLAERLAGLRRAGPDPRAHRDPRAAARAPAGPAPDQPAQRLPAHRRRRLHAPRHHGLLEPARRLAVVRDRRADVGAGARGDAADPAAGGVAARPASWQAGVGHSLIGKTLGIYGYGRIGEGRGRLRRRVRHAGAGLGAAGVAASGRAPTATRWPRAEDDFFAECDVLSLHLRLVPATRGIVTAADLARMKPTALFVNTSRAGLIEPGALVAALRSGRPGMAAVDVFEDEPLRDPYASAAHLDNVVCTPHIGYVTHEEWELQFADVFDQINAFAAGEPINVVNP